jgi:GH24 family phage-related lysozyme (muramidase)
MVKLGKLDRVGPAMELWNKGTVKGKFVVINGLVRRRAADRAIFDQGDYSGRP